jgi:hypothetical protein
VRDALRHRLPKHHVFAAKACQLVLHDIQQDLLAEAGALGVLAIALTPLQAVLFGPKLLRLLLRVQLALL